MTQKSLLGILIVLTLFVVVLLVLIYQKIGNAQPTPMTIVQQTPSTPTNVVVQSPSQPTYYTSTFVLVSTYSVAIPIISENFVISAEPYVVKQAILKVWFNLLKTTALRGDSLVITTSTVLTTLAPLILSEDLKKNNVPFEGYSYLVIQTSAPIKIHVSFVS